MKISSLRMQVSGEASEIWTLEEECGFIIEGEKFEFIVDSVNAFRIGSDDASAEIVLIPKPDK